MGWSKLLMAAAVAILTSLEAASGATRTAKSDARVHDNVFLLPDGVPVEVQTGSSIDKTEVGTIKELRDAYKHRLKWSCESVVTAQLNFILTCTSPKRGTKAPSVHQYFGLIWTAARPPFEVRSLTIQAGLQDLALQTPTDLARDLEMTLYPRTGDE